MKKFISAVAAISMCALMLAACGNNGTTDEGSTESVTAEASADVTEDTSSADTEQDKSEDDTSDDEDENDIVIDNDDNDTDSGDMLSYDSFDDIDVSEIFTVDHEYIAAEESNMYSFAKTLEGGTEFYFDAEATDGSVSITMAFSQDKIAMNAFDGSSATEISIIIKDGMIYMLSPDEKSGFYFTADEEIMSQYDLESMLSQANIDSDMELSEVKSGAVIVGGEKYTFEFNDESGMLFNADGKLRAMISAEGSNGMHTLVVNEFSSNVPANAYDIPDDYTLTDLESALS